jgi:carboxyl-terminal processing protease
MSRWNLAWMIVIPLSVILGITLSYSAPQNARDKDYELVRLVVDVLAEVDQHYVRQLDDKAKRKLVEDMINLGLERLDPHSGYMSAEEYKHFERTSEGVFGGVGIQLGIDPKTGRLMVISPMVGTPAFEAGVLADDLIIKINDLSTESMRISDAITHIQGEPGTPISFTVFRGGEKAPLTLSMKRARIEVESVLGYSRNQDNLKEWDWFADKESGIAYIRLTNFGEHTAADLRKVLEKLETQGAKGLILDLRDNPGGLLTSAVEISDMFLTEGKIVSIRDRHDKGKVYEAKSSGTLFEPANKHPIVVLINKNSASASEIVSSALQDHKRAVIIGERSYGKGSVQKIIKLSNDPITALKLTTDSYWRPSGVNIHRHEGDKETDEWGVKPNIGFEVSLKDEERIAYLKYRRNLDIIKKKKDTEEKPFVDRAMQKSLEYLKKELNGIGAAPGIDFQTGVKT